MKLVEYSEALRRNRGNEDIKNEYYKRCYELFESSNNVHKKLIEISYEEGVSYMTIKNNAKEYFLKYIGDEKKWNQTYVYPKRGSIKKVWDLLLFKLMKVNDPDKIIEIFEYYNPEMYGLRNYILRFLSEFFPEQYDKMVDDLNRKLEFFINYKKEEKKKNINYQKQKENYDYVEKNKYLLEEFIVGDYETKQRYCNIQKINLKEFDRLVELVKNYDNELYLQYEEVINNYNNVRFKVYVRLIKELVYYIQNGIKEENGVIRQFDIVDYYLLVGLDFETILNVIKDIELTTNELRLLKIFIAKHKSSIKDSSNDVHHILNPDNKEMIGGRVIELAEKEFILSFLKKNKIPKNNTTYKVAMRRYLNDTLPIEEKGKKL